MYLILGWCEFNRSKNSKKVRSVSGHMTKMSSMHRFQSKGMGVPFCDIESRNSCSRLAMKRFAKVGAHLVPWQLPVSAYMLSR